MTKNKQRLRWVKKDNKTICETLIDGEWVEHKEVNDGQSRFFHDSPDEPQRKSNIIFKGI